MSVWVRRSSCVRPPGNVLGDGGFAAWSPRAPDADPPAADTVAWPYRSGPNDGGGCWEPRGVEDGFSLDWDHVRPDGEAPSLRVTAGGAPHARLRQHDLTFIAGHRYRLRLWIASDVATNVNVTLWDGSVAFASGPFYSGPAWTYHELWFRPVTLAILQDPKWIYTFEGTLGIDIYGGATVWIDDVQIDEGEPCPPDPGSLVANGDFTDGLACWAATGLKGSADSWPYGPTEADAPSLSLSSRRWPSDPRDPFSLQQVGIRLEPGHTYRCSIDTKQIVGDLYVSLSTTSTWLWGWRPSLAETWQHQSAEFAPPIDFPVDAQLTLTLIEDYYSAAIDIDNLRIEDLGPSP